MIPTRVMVNPDGSYVVRMPENCTWKELSGVLRLVQRSAGLSTGPMTVTPLKGNQPGWTSMRIAA